MLAMIDLDWGANDAIKKLSRKDYNALAQAVPQLNLELWKEDKNEPPHFYSSKILIDLVVDSPVLVHYGLEFKIKNFKNTYHVKTTDATGSTTNINVAIPNVGLLMIDQVQVMEDACTDRLQTQLDLGWRILAICPPNGVRRPDYILGRTQEK